VASGSLRPRFSRQARRQLARLARARPELLDRVVEVTSHLVQEPFAGLHKPEPLLGDLFGFWSVRLNQRDRLVYRVEGGDLLIQSVEGHYEDR
jgi:toxin YoeB